MEPDIRLADRVVIEDHVGSVFRVSAKKLVLCTPQGFVSFSRAKPTRPVMQNADARARVAAMCAGTPIDGAFTEIAFVLGLSERQLRASIRRNDPTCAPVECPRVFPNHEYQGAFRVERSLVAADRCYVKDTRPLLSVRHAARAGTWHAYLRPNELFANRTVGLVVVHEDFIEDLKAAGESLGAFGVDAGCAVIVSDQVSPRTLDKLVEDPSWEEGMIDDVGCYARTHDGDGVFNARGITKDGALVMLRLNLTGDATYDTFTASASVAYIKAFDEAAALDASPVRDYSPKETFAKGDRIRHPKLGEGLVEDVLEGDKVQIAFRAGVKTLIHGRA